MNAMHDAKNYDVIIAGSGFAGATLAMILAKKNYNVLMVEKGAHPRFALGESATPLTTWFFSNFAEKHDLPELKSLSNYSDMKADLGGLNCGPKELFYYLSHVKNHRPKNYAESLGEVVVQTQSVDLQYDRADLDLYLVKAAIGRGTEYLDRTEITTIKFDDAGVELGLKKDGANSTCRGSFFIDATGHQSILANELSFRIQGDDLDIPLKSRSIFTHFKNVRSLEDVLGNGSNFNIDNPVHRYRGTQHHCFDGGWYWFIPFDNGITSVGVSLDMDLHPMNDKDPQAEFFEVTSELPIVDELLKGATSTMPFIKTGRLQFSTKKMVGDRWAMLPAAAFGIDAWQSTGMTLSMLAIDRLTWLLDNIVFKFNRFDSHSIVSYERQLLNERFHLSNYSYGIYKSFKHPELFKLYSLLPFMGTEDFVGGGGLGRPWDDNALLMNFGNPHWRESFYQIFNVVVDASRRNLSASDIEAVRNGMLDTMARYNSRAYGCPSKRNVYLAQESIATKWMSVNEVPHHIEGLA